MESFSGGSRLSAYTLPEVAVGLVVGAIVLNIAYLVYEGFNEKASTFVNVVDEVNQAMELISIFELEFNRCQHASMNEDSSIALVDNGDTIVYRFSSKAIRMVGKRVNYFESKFRIESLTHCNDSTGKIDTLLLSWKERPYLMVKNYSCENFVNESADPYF